MTNRIDEIFNQVMDESSPDPLRRFAELVAADERQALAPQKREWVGLTGLEISHYNSRLSGSGVAEEIDALLKEKNGGFI